MSMCGVGDWGLLDFSQVLILIGYWDGFVCALFLLLFNFMGRALFELSTVQCTPYIHIESWRDICCYSFLLSWFT